MKNHLSNMKDFLRGKKTYIIAACVAVIAAAQYLGFVPADVAATLYGLLGAGGLATLRAGVSNG